MQKEAIAAKGTVSRSMPDATLRIHLDNGHDVRAAAPRNVRIVPGDRVTVELSSGDLSQGKITTWAR
jgi:translation initiation factor IF-1